MKASLGGIKSLSRRCVAKAFHISGLHRWRHRGKAIVLTYHRVLTPEELSNRPVQPGMYLLDSVFAQQMEFLQRQFTIVSMQALLELWRDGQWDSRTRYCAITFDDGWLDNYLHAYPALKKLGIPATIFLPTDYVGTEKWFWPDQVYFLLNAARENHARTKDGRGIEDLLSCYLQGDARVLVKAIMEQKSGIDQMIEQCKNLPMERIHELIIALMAEIGVSLPQQRVILNWEEVREMSQHGISFGSHSCSHRILTKIAKDDMLDELTRSKQTLLEQRVNYVPVFCYPNGNNNGQLQELVKECGYEAAVGVSAGVEGSQPRNRYEISRVGIHHDVTKTVSLFSFRLFGVGV
jgi:peptidoglycan/xylan/chitin deacetylase (PgdA/CDA1 family)